MTGVATIHCLIPNFLPAGGVVKVMDYVTHALSHQFRVTVHSARARAAGDTLFEIERFRHLEDDDRVTVETGFNVVMTGDDLIFFSLPKHYEAAVRALPVGAAPERIVHIVQGLRHTNPTWRHGHALRTLTRPASRISISDIVGESIAPYLDPRGVHRVIRMGHDLGFFSRSRELGARRVLRVGYTAWKSDVGDRVAERLSGDANFEFRGIRDVASWDDLADLYEWSDVFLSTPLHEEGFYLPGLEAMASGAIVVTPDAGGNMAYCRPDENCVLVDFDSVDGYVAALHQVRTWSDERATAFRESGHRTCDSFDLGIERAQFGEFLLEVIHRAEVREAGRN